MNAVTLFLLSIVLVLPGTLRADDTSTSSGEQTVTVPQSNGAVQQFRPPPAAPVPTATSSGGSTPSPTLRTHHKHTPQSSYTAEQQLQAQTLTRSLSEYNAQQWASFKTLWTAQKNTVLTDSALSPTQKREALAQVSQQERAASATLNQQLQTNAAQKWSALRQRWAQNGSINASSVNQGTTAVGQPTSTPK